MNFLLNKRVTAMAAVMVMLLASLAVVQTIQAVNPQVPPGIEDPADLAYGKHSNFGAAAYDAEFLDRVEWLRERAGVPLGVSYFTPRGADPVAGSEPRLPVEIQFCEAAGACFHTTAYYVRHTPHVALVALKSIFAKQPTPQVEMYPGYEVRHPVSGDPVGEAWPEMEKRWGRKAGTLFRASAQDGDAFKTGAEFKRANGEVYIKQRMVVEQQLWQAKLGVVWERTR